MKSKGLYYSALTVLPVLLALTTIYLNHARGPFWLGTNLDPDYVYLLNAVNTADLKKVGHIDHPGTTVQVLGAIIIRTVHLFRFSTKDDLQTDVLKHPEYYLTAINTVFAALNAGMLLILGFVCYRWTHHPWLCLWLQLAPFFSTPLLNAALTRVSPEPLLLLAGLLITLLLVKTMQTPAYSSRVVFLFALVTGFGIASKVTFLPLLAIGMIAFPGLKKKLAYLGGVLSGFVLFTLPIIGMYPQFFHWIYNLITHKKSYGAGEKGIISLRLYIKNLEKLLTGNPFFTLVLVTSLLLVVIVVMVPALRRISVHNKKFKLVVSVLAAQVLGVLMVGKHPAYHYLLPVLSLGGIMVFLLFYFCKDLLNYFKLSLNYLVFPFLVFIAGSFILLNPVKQVMALAGKKFQVREKSLAVYREAERHYPGYAKVYYYASSAPAYALKFGNNLSRNDHAKILAQLYSDVYFYDSIKKEFFTFDYNQRVPLGFLRTKYEDKILFQGPSRVKVPGLKLEKVYKGGFPETIFLVDPGAAQLTRQVVEWIESHIAANSALVLPEEWGPGAAGLQHDYHLVPVNYKNIDKNFFTYLALFFEKPYFVVPSVQYYGKNVLSPKSIKKLKNFIEQIKIEAVFPDDTIPLFSIGSLDAIAAERGVPSFEYQEIKVWFPLKKNKEKICPALQILGHRGTFELDYKRGAGENREGRENLLVVSNSEAGEQGKRICLLGFSANQKGFDLDISGAKTLHLMMEIDLPGHLITKGNQLFIQDYDGRWERKSVNFPGVGRSIYLVSKKIRPQSTKLQLGIQFSPRSTGDTLIIRSIKVFITRERI
jgi:hypothetical protein